MTGDQELVRILLTRAGMIVEDWSEPLITQAHSDPEEMRACERHLKTALLLGRLAQALRQI